MRNVGERTAMNKGRVVLERLHQVRLHGLRQKHGHRAIRLDVAAIDGRAVTTIGDDDVAKTLLQVLDVGGEAENRHHLGGDGDVEPGLARKPV